MATSERVEWADPAAKEPHGGMGWPHLSTRTGACMCACSRCLGDGGCRCRLCSGAGHAGCRRAQARIPVGEVRDAAVA